VAFEPASIIITAVGRGTVGSSDDGVAPATALLRLPSDVDVGPDGSIYIADSGNQRVWKVTTDGVVTSFAGNGMLGSSGDGGPGVNATLNMPCAVAADSNGNVYISDTLNQRVRRVAPDGTITTVAGTGAEGDAGDDGPAVAAELDSPVGVADRHGREFLHR
jgi:sugar lactone lactonase YvrE